VLERIESPENVLAFRAVGTIDASDYETVLAPAVEAMLAERGELRFVYVLGAGFDGYSFGAGWEDAKLGVGHVTKWKRCAVVTDHEWIRHTVGAFRWMMPGDLKLFEPGQDEAAIAWAAG
jgi:hypothetical protein